MGDVGGRCPKCGGVAWIEEDDGTLLQRCLCGLARVVYLSKDGFTISHAIKRASVSLPKKGTKLARCLAQVAIEYPKPVQTIEVAGVLEDTTGAVSAHLMILSYRGLVEKVEERRGVSGGSYWSLTSRAVELLGLLIRR